MNLLTDDMSAAIEGTELAAVDKVIIKAILYQERQNKERTWDTDAEKYITKLVDENAPEVSAS